MERRKRLYAETTTTLESLDADGTLSSLFSHNFPFLFHTNSQSHTYTKHVFLLINSV